MNIIRTVITIILAGILTDNYVLSKFLGICPFLGVSKKLDTAMGMSAAVIFVMVLSTAVTYPIQRFVLEALGLEYLQTVVFILIIAALVQLIEIALRKYMPTLHAALGVYLPLITTNCAVLGCAILVTENYGSADYSFGIGYLYALSCAFGSGVGFLVAMAIFAGVRRRMEFCDVPETLRGLPITLSAASLVAMSFLGFAGI
ncbi:MAG: RnfABCDGE type electron transport complex subunit A [Clostridia bacterium]|nr:RnfABCDGE type electron transport complex subunit A [Clostridia bacterium]